MNTIERADRAAKLLGDPVLSEAFAAVEAALHAQWGECPLRDRDGAHELRLMLKLLRDVRANLERAVANGKLEKAEIERTTLERARRKVASIYR